MAQSAKISEHEPRKGTETRALDELPRRHATISEHEPRKGTETLNILPIVPSQLKFQNTNPERGRKQPSRWSLSPTG